MKSIVLCVFSVFLFAGCTIRDKKEMPLAVPNPYRAAERQIEDGKLLVKDGDLVVRNGQEFSSQVVKNFNRQDKTYSHAGLVFVKNGQPMVYHIVPGDENPDLKLRADSFALFCNPRKNFGFALYRFDLDSTETASLRSQVLDWYQQGLSFDSVFDIKSDDRMYCSEMIKKGLAKATANRINISTTQPTTTEAHFFALHLKLPLSYAKSMKVVPIDALYLHSHSRPLRRFDFSTQQ